MSCDSIEEKLHHSITQGLFWLASIRDTEGIYPIHTLASHYKSPLLFAEANLAAEGREILTWIANNYMTEAGHFNDPADSTAKSRFYDLYEDLWIAWGASRLHRDDIANTILAFCLRYFHEENGGFRSTVASIASETVALYDLRSTALGGIAALAQNQIDIAKACALFTMKLIWDQQDDSGQFFLVRDKQNAIVKQFPLSLERVFVVPATLNTTGTPLYYALALAIIFLVQIYRNTRNEEYLNAAKRYAFIYHRHEPRILTNHYSGKVAWSLAWLSEASGDSSYLNAARVAANYMLSNQLSSGEWTVPTLYPHPDNQPLSVTIDRTSEYVLIANYLKDVFLTSEKAQ